MATSYNSTTVIGDGRKPSHQYPTRHAAVGGLNDPHPTVENVSSRQRADGSSSDMSLSHISSFAHMSPNKKDLKHVVFQLIDPGDPRYQARLPMRVMISPNDGTDSIISTVKNFYGLYECGVSFENKEGISIIAHHDNFHNNMTVYVRMVAQPQVKTEPSTETTSPKRLTLGPAIEMRPPTFNSGHSPSRATGRSIGNRSASPSSEFGKGKSLKHKIKDRSITGDADGYSSGDNDQESVTSSRRSKVEEIKADITVDNIVEGGRRKRAFESSELPLFVPPQVPISASISSISPQRRTAPLAGASPYASSNQQTFSYTQPLPSPQSYGAVFQNGMARMPPNPYQTNQQNGNRYLRGSRTSGASWSSQRASNGILPTPDPTISVISDEDVALQLIRLGDPSAFSHGRTSTSTADDALSGKADAASSDEEEEEDDEDEDDDPRRGFSAGLRDARDELGPQRKKQRTGNELRSDGTSGEDYDDQRDGTFDVARKVNRPKPKKGIATTTSGKSRTLSMTKMKKPTIQTTSHNHTSSTASKPPMSPASLPPHSRKPSVSSASINFHHQLGEDEEDLSSKPRCQRCRKSKKGCDRQRPCGRCKDAGIGIEGCISEDEGNGRKGRYGRHMGVTVKKAEEGFVDGEVIPPGTKTAVIAAGVTGASAPGVAMAVGNVMNGMPHGVAVASAMSNGAGGGVFLAPALPDKNGGKKRKR